MPEHLGTHLDAPNHFERNQPGIDKIAPEQLFAAGVVIDISAAASMNEDYRLSDADVAAWEQAHGRIPAGAIVLLHTGWGRHWTNVARYQNRDVQGRLHFPGFSAEAAKLLIHERGAKGIGIDTLSVDYGLSRDFVVHHVVNRAGRYALENVAQLEQLPPVGFYLVVAPIKIETGSGGPTRIFAIVP
jgi:kynurenine formamidase